MAEGSRSEHRIRKSVKEKLKHAEALRRNGPGVYVHMVYDIRSPQDAGVYVGANMILKKRIEQHINDFGGCYCCVLHI